MPGAWNPGASITAAQRVSPGSGSEQLPEQGVAVQAGWLGLSQQGNPRTWENWRMSWQLSTRIHVLRAVLWARGMKKYVASCCGVANAS